MKKVALVTGSSRGIGRAVAAELARDGYAVCINYYERKDKADELAALLRAEGREAIAVQADVSKRSEVNAMVAQCERELGKIMLLVNNAGEIDFPVIGTLRVGGLTKNEAESLIRERLRPYLKEAPIVTVRMANYKISVLGEVARPGSFTIGNEKVNVLEALAMAGDMTIYGVRDNVKLIREDESGKRKIINLDLNNAGIVTSPYYYLKQNDILYVTPNETKAKNSDIGNSTTLWVSSISILVSIAGLLVNILK